LELPADPNTFANTLGVVLGGRLGGRELWGVLFDARPRPGRRARQVSG
jgi:hypothetical protein